MKTRPQMIRRRAEDQDPGLAQALAEEAQDPARVDLAGDPEPKRAISPKESSQPRGTSSQAFTRPHRIVCSSGLVASRVWVKT